MKNLFLSGVAAAAVLALSVGSASAAPVAITVDPAAAGLSSNALPFTFTGIRTSDFSSINLHQTGTGTFTFQEKGYLPLSSFDPGNFTPNGLNGTASPFVNPYGLYLAFNGTGSLTFDATTNTLKGSFNPDLAYTLMGDPGYNSSFNHFDANHQVVCSGCAGDVTLANGSLNPAGPNTVQISTGPGGTPDLPAAFVNLLFNATSTTFFKTPSAPFTVGLNTQFSNTNGVVNRYTTGAPTGYEQVITIGTTDNVGGAGSGQFEGSAIPEPASMMLLGTGLLGVGLVRRRRSAGRA